MNKPNNQQSTTVYRIRNKNSKEFISDGKHANRNAKRFYYSLGAAKSAISLLTRYNKCTQVDTNGKVIPKYLFNPVDFEIVEFDLVEKSTIPALDTTASF